MPLSRPVVITLGALIAALLLGIVLVIGRCDFGQTPISSATARPEAAELPAQTPVQTVAATAPAAPAVPGGAAAPTQRPAPPTGQTIVSFTVPATVKCASNGTPATVHLAWSTANTTGVTISIDGPGKYDDYAATGSADVPFACSETQHTYLITTRGTGSPATKTVIVRRV